MGVGRRSAMRTGRLRALVAVTMAVSSLVVFVMVRRLTRSTPAKPFPVQMIHVAPSPEVAWKS